MKKYFSLYQETYFRALTETQVTNVAGDIVEQQQALEQLSAFSDEVSRAGKKQYFIGNGASMAFSDHMAIDWSKNGQVPTHSFSNTALLTALGNDLGVKELFAFAVSTYADEDDLLVAISSSGNSPNITEAIKAAQQKQMHIVTFSGLEPDNKARQMGDLNFYVPAKTYGVVECAHQLLLHMWLDHYMGITEWDRECYQNMNKEQFQL